MRLLSPGRFFRTIAHLRAGQFAEQVRVRITPGWRNPSWVASRTPPPVPSIRWHPVSAWLHPDTQTNSAESMLAGRFTFVGLERSVGWPPDYTCGDAPLLWQYNLHYLEWLWALPPEGRLAAALDWSRRHPPVAGAAGWSPYPTSLRLETLCLVAAEGGSNVALLWPSIWRQAEHLSRRLEYHLLGNHLLENAIALSFVGACFLGVDADRWLRTGLDILRRQLPEQVLGDGMHFERSPMYQLRLVHALALLANTGEPEVRDVVAEPLARMIAALAPLCHPDGQIALLNDSAFGIYPDPGRVTAFAVAALGGAPPPAPRHLPDAGYFTGRRGGDAVICDAGPLGPEYLPGHSHGDIFSFELSLGGRRVVVDSGTYDYEASSMRSYCRSTAAHNTVTVDGEDQAEFWAAFRVGRRGKPRDVRCVPQPDGFELSGWHDGFVHLPGRPVHRRVFRWHDDGVLMLSDTVTATRPVTAASRLHLHPECRLVEVTDRLVRATCGDVAFTVGVLQGPDPTLTDGWYCPRFGVHMKQPVIVFETRGARSEIAIVIASGHDLTFDNEASTVVVGGRSYVA